MPTAPPLTQIIELLGRLDTAWLIEPSFGKANGWEPQTPEIAAVIAELTSLENRDALIAWYGRCTKSEMNPSARWLCEYLEHKIGAPLGRVLA
jgi:hypothetical protein